jgi:hypothetical protein
MSRANFVTGQVSDVNGAALPHADLRYRLRNSDGTLGIEKVNRTDRDGRFTLACEQHGSGTAQGRLGDALSGTVEWQAGQHVSLVVPTRGVVMIRVNLPSGGIPLVARAGRHNWSWRDGRLDWEFDPKLFKRYGRPTIDGIVSLPSDAVAAEERWFFQIPEYGEYLFMPKEALSAGRVYELHLPEQPDTSAVRIHLPPWAANARHITLRVREVQDGIGRNAPMTYVVSAPGTFGADANITIGKVHPGRYRAYLSCNDARVESVAFDVDATSVVELRL